MFSCCAQPCTLGIAVSIPGPCENMGWPAQHGYLLDIWMAWIPNQASLKLCNLLEKCKELFCEIMQGLQQLNQ